MGTGFDAIIIGSGFGGSISACRLAEAGAKVLVLERGRHWEPEEAEDVTAYPRKLGDPWIWDQNHPERFSGWTDLRIFKGMAVVAGAGVGGGSLIYANVSIVPPEKVFKAPWPAEIRFSGLQEYFQKVEDMLDLQVLPDNQINPRFRLMQEGAKAIGAQDRFGKLPLAISFRQDLNLDPANPPDKTASLPQRKNKHGALQGTCFHAGICDFGCPVKARNTLDVNYLFLAQQKGAKVRPLHFVTKIEQEGTGYRVHFNIIDTEKKTLTPGSEAADRVILAAGSLGSTEILFRARDQYRTLPRISRFLGQRWSSNGDLLTPAFYLFRKLYPTVGPVISSSIKFLDGSRENQSFIIEDGGIPNLLQKHMEEVKSQKVQLAGKHPFEMILQSLQEAVQNSVFKFDPVAHTMPWFANGVDAGDGEYQLQDSQFNLNWDITRSIPAFQAEVNTHELLSVKTGGLPVNPFWREALITPHPLGGCNMGNTAADGVVNHAGEVFGYENLYVVDGASIPTPIGVNPSRTISAIAERAATLMIAKPARQRKAAGGGAGQ